MAQNELVLSDIKLPTSLSVNKKPTKEMDCEFLRLCNTVRYSTLSKPVQQNFTQS